MKVMCLLQMAKTYTRATHTVSFMQVMSIYTVHRNHNSQRMPQRASSSQPLIVQQGEAVLISYHCKDERFLKPPSLSHFGQHPDIFHCQCLHVCAHVHCFPLYHPISPINLNHPMLLRCSILHTAHSCRLCNPAHTQITPPQL